MSLALKVGRHSLSEFTDVHDGDPRGLLYIFEEPRPNATYIVACDPSYGLAGWQRALRTEDDERTDNCAVQVLRCGRSRGVRSGRDVQVAEYAAPIDAEDAAAIVNFLGRMYAGTGDDGMAQAIVEVQPGPGLLTQRELQNRFGYTNLFVWKHLDRMEVKPTLSYGWYSSRQSRQALWIRGTRHINQHKIIINSPWLVEEMTDCVLDNFLSFTARAQWGCFVRGTTVLLENGEPLPIEQMARAYSVITHAGRSCRIQHVIPQQHKGKLVKLTVSGLPEVIGVTPNHLCWARRRTKKFLQSYAVRKTPQSEWVAAGELKKGDWLAVPKRVDLPKTELSDDQLHAIGFWLAEGNFVRDAHGELWGIELTNTNPALIEKAARTFKAWFPLTRVRKNQFDRDGQLREARSWSGERQRHIQHKPVHRWVFWCREAAQFFEQFGGYCRDKHLPKELYCSSGLLQIVAGFFDGDGSQRKNQQHDANLYTTSKWLAWQLRQIMIDSGVWTTLRQATERRDHNPSWVLNIKAGYLSKLKAMRLTQHEHKVRKLTMEDEGYFYTPIKAVQTIPFDDEVFDLTVARDHSYTAGGVAVHNCHDDRIVALLMAIWAANEWNFENAPEESRAIENASLPDYQRSDIGYDEMNDDWNQRFAQLGDY